MFNIIDITVGVCDYAVRIPDNAMYNELQGILTSSYTPMNPVEGYCRVDIISDFAFAIKLELLHSSGVRSAISFPDLLKFSPSAKAGETLLLQHKPIASTARMRTSESAVFIIRYEGNYFYKIIELWCN